MAEDDEGLTGEVTVTVDVENVQEAGTLSLSSIQPAINRPLTASITDEDGDVNAEEWQWYSMATKPKHDPAAGRQ